jgi:hypothetical protein
VAQNKTGARRPRFVVRDGSAVLAAVADEAQQVEEQVDEVEIQPTGRP